MTVLEFNQRESRHNPVVVILGVLTVGSFILGIFLYNNLISLRHDVSQNKEIISEIQIRDVELKDKLYELIDGIDQEEFLKASGLVVEKNPIYVVSSNTSVSSNN